MTKVTTKDRAVILRTRPVSNTSIEKVTRVIQRAGTEGPNELVRISLPRILFLERRA